jgi:RNA polymerase sigma-70 factor (ECF subfamily)
MVESNRASLTLLFTKYRGALFNHVKRLVRSPDDAAELVQETYVRVMTRATIAEFESIARAYLFQTATNLARDHFRRRRFRDHEALDDVPEPAAPASAGSPEDQVLWAQAMETLATAIDEMPANVRAVFVLARLEHKSYVEIAAELGLSGRTVERRMSEAIEILSLRLEELL